MFTGLTAPTDSRHVFGTYRSDMLRLMRWREWFPYDECEDRLHDFFIWWTRPGARDPWAEWQGRCRPAPWFLGTVYRYRWNVTRIYRKPLPVINVTWIENLGSDSTSSEFILPISVREKRAALDRWMGTDPKIDRKQWETFWRWSLDDLPASDMTGVCKSRVSDMRRKLWAMG